MLYATRVKQSKRRIFHVSTRETVRGLRDEILRMHGFEVQSTLSPRDALDKVSCERYDLVLIDVVGDNGVADAEQLCGEIKKAVPHQHVAYVCNYRVAIDSACPDDVIRTEFNPEAFVEGVRDCVVLKS